MTESGKIVTATALSVLAHVSLFTVLALLPEAPLEATPPPSLEAEAEAPAPSLEVTLEAAAPVPPPQPPQTAQLSVPPPSPEPAPAAAQAIRTQLDPENLRQSEEAPEHAQTLAAHNSKATQEAAPKPTPAAKEANDPADLSVTSKPTPTPGEIGIDALGHYGKAVGNAIGIRWNLHRKAHNPPLAVGEVRVQFIIDAQGHASEISILSNTAGSANAAVACKAVQEAKIPPIPPDRLAQLPGGRMRIVYSFTIYSSQ